MLLELVALQSLLVLDLLLRVLVRLQDLVVLLLSLLQVLVHLVFELLAERVHLVLLLLHHLGLCGEDLLVTGFHVKRSLLLLHLVGALLDLMSLLVIFLFGQVLLDFAHVQKLSREFEG